MSNIVYVSPQVFLVSKDGWKSDHRKEGYIPILKADLPKLQQALRKVIDTHGNLKDHQSRNTSTVLINGKQQNNCSSTLTSENGAGLVKGNTKFQSLKQFLPITLEQQLHTISIQGIPSQLSNDQIELFLSKCVRFCLELLGITGDYKDLIECWTNVQFYGLETQDVFVRFTQDSNERYSQICKILQLSFGGESNKMEFHMDSNTKRFIDDQNTKVPEVDRSHIELLSSAMEDLRSQEESTAKEDLSLEGYQIDLTTLSDLPTDSLDQLCKDIVNFRTKVVSIEKEKRERQAYEESRRRRHQMMRMFDQIRKSRNEDVDSDYEDEDGEGNHGGAASAADDAADGEDEDEDEDEDDFLVENRRLEKEKAESTKRYEALLGSLQTVIQPRIRSVHTAIEQAEHYEEVLLKRRPLFLKELLHQASDPYYDHHRAFKEDEEKRDSIQREESRAAASGNEKAPVLVEQTAMSEPEPESAPEVQHQRQPRSRSPQEEHTAEQFKIKFAFRKAIEKSVDSSSDHEQPELPTEAEVQATRQPLADDLPFTQEQLDQRLASLRSSKLVDELVKEYLGVYEDDLVDYIFDNIHEHKNRQVLLDELQETFDDDAKTIVHAIWASEPFTAH